MDKIILDDKICNICFCMDGRILCNDYNSKLCLQIPVDHVKSDVIMSFDNWLKYLSQIK